MIEPALELPFLEELTLLRELNHRIKNEFACAISIVTQAAVRSGNEEVKAALTRVSELLHKFVDIHCAMERPEHHTFVNAAAYLEELCTSISRSRLDHMKIKLVLTASPLQLQSDRCWRLGMIVSELVTNAARHAFGEDGGEIRVELKTSSNFVECCVADDGTASAQISPARGLKIVEALVDGLDGRIERRHSSKGTTWALTFPIGL